MKIRGRIQEIEPIVDDPAQVNASFLYGVCVCVSETQHFQQKLDETTKLLRELQEAQRERLSVKQPLNICLPAPTTKELQLGNTLF